MQSPHADRELLFKIGQLGKHAAAELTKWLVISDHELEQSAIFGVRRARRFGNVAAQVRYRKRAKMQWLPKAVGDADRKLIQVAGTHEPERKGIAVGHDIAMKIGLHRQRNVGLRL